MNRFIGLVLRSVGAFLFLFGWVIGARAELIVLHSDVPSIPAKSQLADNAMLNIPDGRQVQVVLPSGKTRILRGPIKGNVADFTRGEPKPAGVWDKVAAFLKSGGSDDGKFGGDRDSSFYLINAVRLGAEGSICAERGTPPLLLRTSSDGPTDVTIRDNERSDFKATLHFDRGVKEQSWPSNIPLRDRATYHVSPADGTAVNVTLRLLPDNQDADLALMVFYERNCQVQLRSWLRQHTK